MAEVEAKIEKIVAAGMPGEVVRVTIWVAGGERFVWERYEYKGSGPVEEVWYRDVLLDQAFAAMRSRAVIR